MSPELVLLLIFLSIPLLAVVWAIATFNGLVRLRNYCGESWSNIDTELKRRYDLIPNLVNTVKGYAAHERDVLERVTAARNAAQANNGSPLTQAKDENVLVENLRRLMAVVESYPQLKADRHFLELQQELVNTEDRIQRARRFYNANVRDLNTRIESVPSNIIAGFFHFQPREQFEIEDAVRQTPKVEFADG
jgi:LemA protein